MDIINNGYYYSSHASFLSSMCKSKNIFRIIICVTISTLLFRYKICLKCLNRRVRPSITFNFILKIKRPWSRIITPMKQ